jgi:hypothetical protein
MESFSSNDLLSSALASQKPSKFVFVTISNPGEIKDSKKQSVIRRHARASTLSSKPKRRNQIKLVFDLPDAASQVTTESNATSSPVHVVQSLEHTNEASIGDDMNGHSSSPSSSDIPLDSLRPIGSGRGFLPSLTFPVAADLRVRHLTDFSLFYHL